MKKRFTKKEISWILYDWANSAYSILVASILPIFFGVIADAAGVSENVQTAHWSFAVAFSSLIIALTAPVLGTITDYKGMRMKFFAAFFVLAVLSVGVISVTNAYVLFILLFAVTNFAFAGANVFYDAFLVDVTSVERMDKVSSWGFAMGYIGGSTIPFIASIALYMLADDSLIPTLMISSVEAMRVACGITAVWWAVFTIPFFMNVRQTSGIEREPRILKNSLARLVEAFRGIRHEKTLLRFYVAYFCYINGVGAVISMATKLADSLGIGAMYMLAGLFMTQVVAFPCSILYDKLGEKWSHKNMIMIGIATYVVICIVGFFLTTGWQFIMLACLVGTAQGGIQALSRSYYGKLIPDKNKVGQYFGFYSIFGKFESVLGVLMMGLVALFTRDLHFSILPVLALFVIGGLIMLGVPDSEASRA